VGGGGVRRAEVSLRASEERFRGFAENTADTLWIMDAPTTRLEYLSPAFEQTWGEWDEARLTRAVGNLLSNAIKYSTDNGEVIVSVACEIEQSSSWAVLRVKDHGIGIPADDLPHLFEPFHRA
jgi:signal transduction histidine kinase